MPSKFRDRFVKDVVSQYTGQTYKIRRINIFDFIKDMGVLPVATADPVKDELKSSMDQLAEIEKEDPEGFTNRAVTFYLSKGVIFPKIFFGDSDDCPEEEIALEDLGNDANFLVEHITNFSTKLSDDFIKNMDFFLKETDPSSST